jgi:hypothetical protein
MAALRAYSTCSNSPFGEKKGVNPDEELFVQPKREQNMRRRMENMFIVVIIISYFFLLVFSSLQGNLDSDLDSSAESGSL